MTGSPQRSVPEPARDVAGRHVTRAARRRTARRRAHSDASRLPRWTPADPGRRPGSPGPYAKAGTPFRAYQRVSNTPGHSSKRASRPPLPDDPCERLGGRMILRRGGRGRSLEHVDMDGRAGCFGGCGGVALNPSNALQRELLAAAPVASTSSAATLAGQCPSSDKAAERQDAASRRVAPTGRPKREPQVRPSGLGDSDVRTTSPDGALDDLGGGERRPPATLPG
jgi:hypothetical protein